MNQFNIELFMDYRYLKAFLHTAKHCSFSRAAEDLGVAQSAISRQIKLLEEYLGFELIIRSSKKVLLTNKGRDLYFMSHQFDESVNELFLKEDKRPLKIGVLHGLLENWLNLVLIKYYKKYSRRVDIRVSTPPDLKKSLSDNQFDLVFTTENIQSELITSLKIFDEKLVLISKGPVDRRRLSDYRWIVYNEGDYFPKLTKQKNESIISVHSITSIANLVRNGVGIAVVPDHTLKKSDKLTITELPELKKSEIYMATLSYDSLPSHINEFAQLVQKTNPASL